MTIDYNQMDSGRQWFSLLPSLARTAAPNQQQVNLQNVDTDNGVIVVMDMSAVTATGTVTVKIEGVDPVSQNVYPILTGTAVAAAGTTALRVQPSAINVANQTANDVIPPVIRITATHGNGVAMTYSLTLLYPN